MKLKTSLINKDIINDVVLFLFDAQVLSIQYRNKSYRLDIEMNTDDHWISTFSILIDQEGLITYTDLNPANIRIENKVRKCMEMFERYLHEEIVF